jgi:hypothetical protein
MGAEAITNVGRCCRAGTREGRHGAEVGDRTRREATAVHDDEGRDRVAGEGARDGQVIVSVQIVRAAGSEGRELEAALEGQGFIRGDWCSGG